MQVFVVDRRKQPLVAKSKGGSDRVGNLMVRCRDCNEAKGNQPVEASLVGEAERLRRIQRKRSAPLDVAAAVNATRKVLAAELEARGLPVETATGGRTRANRRRLGVGKSHALDAACAGVVGTLHSWSRPALTITATGRGSYQRTRLTRHGLPCGYLMRRKSVARFQTRDRVRALVPSGKKAGTYEGGVAVRATGSFDVQTSAATVQGIAAKHCTLVQRADGYTYTTNHGGAPSSPA